MNLSQETLYQVSTAVPYGTPVKGTVGSMFALMGRLNGIGLAANQVGLTQRIIVLDAGGLRTAIINPVITRRKLGNVMSDESCLSFPGREAKMRRSKVVIVEGFDENWLPVKFKLRDIASMAVQHEIGHLNGKVIK